MSKYRKGAAEPIGTTDFNFKAASLNFFSKHYVDGDLIAKGKADRFRIKIWHADGKGNDVVDYDNQISTSGVGTDPEGTVLGGGSIVVHK